MGLATQERAGREKPGPTGKIGLWHWTGVAFHTDHVGRILGIGATIVEVALARQGAWTLIAAQRGNPLAAVAVHAHFVVAAEVTAAAAVARVGVGVNAGIVALLGAHGAVRDAHAVLAARRVAAADIAYHAAVLRTGHGVHTGPIDQRQPRLALTLPIVAVLIPLALVIAGTAAVGIVQQIAAVVASAIRKTSHAPTQAAAAHAPGVVAIIATVAAVVHVDGEIGAIVTACIRTHGADAIARDAGAAVGAIVAALATVVHVAGDVRAHIAACHLAQRTVAIPGNTGRADRTEDATTAAGHLAGGNIHAAERAAAIHRAHVADAHPRDAHAIGPAVVSAGAAVHGIVGQVSACILGHASDLTGGASAANARNAHLAGQTVIAAIAAVVDILRQICAPRGACHQTRVAGAGAAHAGRADKAVVAARAAVEVVGLIVYTCTPAGIGEVGRAGALTRDACAVDGTIVAASAAVLRVAREIRAYALSVAGNRSGGTFAQAVDAGRARGTHGSARAAVVWIGQEVGANAVAIIGRGDFARAALAACTSRAHGAVIAAHTTVLRVGRKIEAARAAVHQSRRAIAKTHRACSAGTAVDSAGAAILGIGGGLHAVRYAQNGRGAITCTGTLGTYRACWTCRPAGAAICLIRGDIDAIGAALGVRWHAYRTTA